MVSIWRKLSVVLLGTSLSFVSIEANPARSNAFVIFNNTGLAGGSRWDAAPRTINGLERSLDGGLRYSLQGGSYEAFRDLFSWNIVPTVADFQNAVEQAFNSWTVVDPVTDLGSTLSFTADLTTPVVGANNGNGGVNISGAEIDLFGSNDAHFWNVGNSRTQGETWFRDINSSVTLTSTTANYSGSRAISGADIIFNSNPQAVYNLDFFRRLLSHELGHALGLGDVEGDINPGAFIDDNYSGSSSATALETLTNPIAQLVDPLNPANSPFSLFAVPNANPGVDTPGVNILMESGGLGIAPGNPVSNLAPLSNDDYAGRQFLYPFVGLSGEIASATFSNPDPTCPPATCTGMGTNSIIWGIPPADAPLGLPNSVSITGNSFTTQLGTPFVVGTVNYFNGSVLAGSEISEVELLLNALIDIPSLGINDLSISDLRSVSIINTPNTDDPDASADFLSISPPSGASNSFGNNFHVLEGNMATAELYGRIIRQQVGLPQPGALPQVTDGELGPFGASILNGIPTGVGNENSVPLDSPTVNQTPPPKFVFELLGFGKVISGEGFVTSKKVPEPTSTLTLLALGTLGAASTLKRKHKQ